MRLYINLIDIIQARQRKFLYCISGPGRAGGSGGAGKRRLHLLQMGGGPPNTRLIAFPHGRKASQGVWAWGPLEL
jgi:hypothetical protein